MKDIPIIGFAAWSGTGKTTLIERIVRRLKVRGFRVAVIKHDGHSFEIDREGKDSWRYTQAGADISLISSAAKTALVERRGLSFDELKGLVRDVDLILVEGWKDGAFPRIGISRAATGKGLAHPADSYMAVVTDEDISCRCPRFGFDDIEEITEFIIMKTQEEFTHFNAEGRAKMV
ncbi:MAG: molybdopterin-guanine dinucleotide biosynthesis protein B, partial [Clostridia bacterium]|nr:molybdopterin-guanine dinucleotide biosynthesis protein B [Clostridia bacterium]